MDDENAKNSINIYSKLGKTKLPAKFAALQMFPAMNVYHNGDSFRANFGNDEWCFKQFKSALE